MPPLQHYPRSDDAHIARLARGKIYTEFRRADPNLRLCVGHANMLDRINENVIKNAAQKSTRRARSRARDPPPQPNSDSTSRIREISDEYNSLKPQVQHVETVDISSGEKNLSLSSHFSILGTETEENTSVTVSVVSVEVDANDSDDSDDFELPPRPVKHQRHQSYGHAPPLMTGKNECAAKGMLATLSISEVLIEEWE
jgi:hypothetical protein